MSFLLRSFALSRLVRVFVLATLPLAVVTPIPAQNLVGNPAKEATATASGEKIAAIFVINRADPQYAAATKQLEDLLTARVAGSGYSIVNPETVANSLTPSELDAQLAHDSSALALARNLGANLILQATITQIAIDKREFHSGDVATTNYLYTLYATYRILDVTRGATLAGDAVKATFTRRASPNTSSTIDWLPQVIDSAAEQMTASLRAAETKVQPKAEAAEVTFAISTGIADATAVPLAVPSIERQRDGTWLVQPGKVELQALDVTVELDGVTLGSAPGSFRARPGLHRLKLTREGFAPWERTINVFKGQTLRVALRMSTEGYARWKDTLLFTAELKAGEKLTDAQVKIMEGRAQMLRQSGFRVDAKALPAISFWRLF